MQWLVIACLLLPSVNESPEQRGLEIAREADRRDSGFGDMTADLVMTLKNRHGQASVRRFTLKVLEQENDGDKSLSVFDQPNDIKGTALLTFTHKTGDDDQWLYLPALKRVKRISSENQAGPFMGSEFAYEDLTSQEIEKFDYKYLHEESMNGFDCFVIERYPRHPKSGYTRQIVWLDKEHYRFIRIDYYDRKDALLKTYTAHDYKQYLDRFWRAGKMLMENHQTGKSTELLWENIRFRTGLTDRDFDQSSLARAR